MSFNEYQVKARQDEWSRSAARDHLAAQARRAAAARRRSNAQRGAAAVARPRRLLQALLRLVSAVGALGRPSSTY
jgi:hypothetical protein